MSEIIQKRISLFIHVGLSVLGLLMPTFGLITLAVLQIQPLSYMIFSMVNSIDSHSDSYLDTFIFGAQALINLLAKLLPAPLFATVFVLNMVASLHYTAHFIDSINSSALTRLSVSFACLFKSLDWRKSEEFCMNLAVDQSLLNVKENAKAEAVLSAKIF